MRILQDPKAFWNYRAKTYDESSGKTYAKAYDKTLKHILRYTNPTDCVLDFACGTGLVSLRLAPHVQTITAIDISPEMIRAAVKKQQAAPSLSGAQLSFSVMDLFSPALSPDSFDVVLACNVLLYLKERTRALSRIRTLLRPNGIFLSATDCLGDRFSREALRKWYLSHTGQMPFVSFDSKRRLMKDIQAAGFQILETETLFQSPTNLFVAAKRTET